MSRTIEGYSIEVSGDCDISNTVQECFPSWDEAVRCLNRTVEEIINKYSVKPICLLRMSSQEICNSEGNVTVYSLRGKYNITIIIKAIYSSKEISLSPEQLVVQSS
jgi:hypothetical protein